MTTPVFSFSFRRTMVALAACAACLPASAQSDGAQTFLSAGLGLISGSSADHAVFGQYNGLRSDRAAFGTLGIDYSLRKEASSTWVQLQGSNLLGDTRELNLVWKKPGDWKFSANYDELVHYDPITVNTGLQGAGSTTPQELALPGGPGSGTDLELKTKRSALGVGFAKWINPALQVQVDLKSENKEGSRLFGVGINCPSVITPGCLGTTGINTGWATLMLPEPISANHTQIEARASYAADKLRVNLGYYGSFYRNNNATLNPSVPGSLYNPLGDLMPLSSGLQALLSQPLALSPDNRAHQLDMSGSYDFTPTTRSTFKLAYGSASQNDNFASAGLGAAPAGVTDLGGRVNTKLAKISLTSRPMPKLSLAADLRYENRDDQTPIAVYNTEGVGTYTNRDLSSRKTLGKLQANWQFSSDYRGTLAAERESIDRGVFTATGAVSGISALRDQTDETGIRAELRRRMSDDFSGSVSLSRARRNGSNWLRDNSGRGVTEVADEATGFLPNAIFMPTLADRRRDKVKLFADWQPSERMSVQFSAEDGKDRYDTPSLYGLHNTRMNQFGVDWSYAFAAGWAANGYATRGYQNLNQSRPGGYIMAFDNTSTSLNLGFSGKPSGRLEVGGSLTYLDDKSIYAQTLDPLAGADSVALLAATGGLPDIVVRQTALKLFGKYALDKGSLLRFDVIYQRSSVNDWAWGYNGVPFVYSDGTTISQKQTQNVGVVGVTYVYRLP